MLYKWLTSLAVIVTLLITAENIKAQDQLKYTNAIRTSFDSETITIDATAGGKGFTGSKINPTCTNCNPSTSRASSASCTLETGDIRVQTSGVAVTSSVGMYITAGQAFTLYGYTDIAALKAIRVTATSGTLNCTYYR